MPVSMPFLKYIFRKNISFLHLPEEIYKQDNHEDIPYLKEEGEDIKHISMLVRIPGLIIHFRIGSKMK